VPAFLATLEVDDLPGFGYKTTQKVEEEFGTTSCGALLEQPKGRLRATLGNSLGETLFGYLRGVDNRKLQPDKERKSVSAEVNVSNFRSCAPVQSY
jgi:DNA repair protein REV1